MRDIVTKIVYSLVLPALVIALFYYTYTTVFRPPEQRNDPVEVKQEEPREDVEDPMLPDVSVTRPEISHYVDGEVKWTVTAESVKSDSASGITELRESEAKFIREEESELDFEAPLTFYDTKEKRVSLEGGIAGRMVPEQHEISASRVDWREKTGVLTASDVRVDFEGARVEGGTMEIKPDEKTVAFSGDVIIEIPVEKLEVNGKENM
ncbi:MAG TPA: LPS export ABC transporter periplasmic protein LptC [bacterium]|nr:LPS export ABC transporter periplasmic protein LptC [bacterium]